jgi:hypothetical protein
MNGERNNRVMGRDRDSWSSRRAARRTERMYKLRDPKLRAYDHGVGVLSIDGHIRGHLASVVLTMSFPPGRPWVWSVIVWGDGAKERSFEDYGPGWCTVRELDAGFLDHHGPSVTQERRFLGLRFVSERPGPPTRYDFAWLPAEEAAKKWRELGLVDADF